MECFKTYTNLKRVLIIVDDCKESSCNSTWNADNLVSVAMVNIYIDEYEEKGLLKRAYSSTKSVTDKITDLGESRIKLLNIQYLESALAGLQ